MDALLMQEEGNSREICCFSVHVIPTSGPVVVHSMQLFGTSTVMPN